MHDRLVSRHIDALYQCFLVNFLCYIINMEQSYSYVLYKMTIF